MRNTEYELELESRSGNRKRHYKFSSADGLNPKNSFRDSELVLADAVNLSENDSLLTVQSGFGFLPAVLGNREGETVGAETSDRAYQLIQRNIGENNLENTFAEKVALYGDFDRRFDKIVYAPHSYEPVDVVKNRLGNLVELLEEEGELSIAGQKTSGINRYKDFLESLTGVNEKVKQQGKQRVYRYKKKGEVQPEKFDVETEFKAELGGLELEFEARKGLFSPKQLDDGTRLLLENIDLSADEDVLDLACGYGIAGIFLKNLYDVEIAFTDDNATATHYAERNLELNSIDEYELKNRDCLDGIDRGFDAIVSNPPTHQGSGVTDEMFKEAHSHLRSGGSLYIVYNQNMKFREQLSGLFAKTEVLQDKNNYRVLRAEKL